MHFHTPPTLLPLLLLPLTTAHVKLVHPAPYGASTLNTNPLLPTGADYPCKLRPGAYAITEWNTIPHDVPQTLAFQGQATHGGGSCQVSLSRDVPPRAESVFRVVKSIEGGCPSGNVGNVGTDPEGFGADAFEFVVPGGVGVGEYTLAWTWFNRVGEREMYMNCAPVRVVGGGGRRGRRERRGKGFDGLPLMFRANVGNGCETAPSGTVLGFPEANLGSVVQRIGDEVLVPPVGSCGVAGSSAVVSNSTETAVAVSSAAPPTTLVPAPSVPVSPPASRAPTAPSVSAAPLVAQASQPPAAPSVSSAAPPSTSGLVSGTCPIPGKSVCSPDGKSWGTCMENHQVLYQSVAAGTKCDPALGVEVPA